MDRGGDSGGDESGRGDDRSGGSGTGTGTGTTGGGGGYDGWEPAAGSTAAGSTAPTSSPSDATTFRRPTSDAGVALPAPVVLAEAPPLQTVSVDVREAGVVGFGVLFLGLVFFGWFVYRRRSRRES